MAGHATWACNDEGRRESQGSNLSDEDWEVVQKRDSLSGAGRSTGVVALPGTVLARAGDWLQWGVDGAQRELDLKVAEVNELAARRRDDDARGAGHRRDRGRRDATGRVKGKVSVI